MIRSRRRWLPWASAQLVAAVALTGLVVALAGAEPVAGARALGVTAVVSATATALFLRRTPFRVTAADGVTHVRLLLLASTAGLLVAAVPVVVAVLVVAAVALDGVDGRVARARRQTSAAGGRFDVAVDCALAAALSLAAADRLGWWVLLLGALPYLFGVAGRAWPWLSGPLPPRLSRKVIGVLPAPGLALALLPQVPATVAAVGVGVVLALVLTSFARDAWLLRRADR